ncbi:uncharacterized protein LOC122505552 [Leptopilina heterotoma]|uniref:uncharacterized protein LOC122505552 n=1 Tax=Leptopilina heterotoma TaxID=63436 RepID=UPI001CA852D1|nr:uncharacterized protein LOC122505552 [Leptopilina heterotoma]
MLSIFIFCIIIVNIVTSIICAPIIVHDDFENGNVNESLEETGDDSNEDNLEAKVPKQILHKSQFFQDLFYEHLAPLLFQFGHACENPTEYEQRFEQRDFENNRHHGKVLWGNANGNYGEHYWDLASGK